ncbi:MAG: tryptophan--tRNA ligase [Sutterellaceae bacterium]|nr:tryptophan--tRNA ligase [Sutterellaceae bacterium]
MTVRVLTGINTTGTLHLGNYCGAIRPCIQASKRSDVESFFFMADLHALIKCQDPARIELSRMQIAASWLAAGLDPEKVTFYRQSDIPEIPLLNWMLNCSCAKGLMNRAHAYKAMVEANEAQALDPDNGVSMGLFCYPVLMTADILMFNANLVPVGRDQVQHLEMARDIATRFNNQYRIDKDFFVMPYEQIDEDMEILPGLDGRKMSKSYNNVIPLFEGGEKALKEAIGRVVTDSKLPGEPKDPDSTSLTQIFDAFATPEERQAFRQELRDGLGWGEAKKRLVAQINAEIGPMRDKYDYYMSHPAELEEILMAGAAKARAISVPFMEELRQAVGLRRFHAVDQTANKETTKAKCALTGTFKQYREADGLFYFKLTAADGTVMLQSEGFENGRDAGMTVGLLKAKGYNDETGAKLALAECVTADDVNAVLDAMRQAQAEKDAAKKAKQ